MSKRLQEMDAHQFQILLQQARYGEVAAREQLFTLSRPYLSQCAEKEIASWLRPKHDCSDLVQVSLLDAHRAFDTFEGNDFPQWLAFLRRILERNATDAVRHFGAAKRRVGKELVLSPQTNDTSGLSEPLLAASGESPSVEAMRQEQAEQLQQAMKQLSADYREVIHLRNLEQLPFEVVAARMNRTRGAVQMLWMRAIKSLEATLHQNHPSSNGG